MKKAISILLILFSLSINAQVPACVWANSTGGNTNSSNDGRAVTTDASGNVFVTGGFRSPTITFGTITLTLTSTYTSNIFIVKYDAAGNALWAKNIGGSGLGEYGWAISTDLSGNVFITGLFRSPTITFGNITVNNTGTNYYNAFIAKYDTNGNVLWAKNAGTSYGGIGHGISNDASGNVFVTGYFTTPDMTIGTFTLNNAGGLNGQSDIFIAKYSANGSVLWAKSHGGTSSDEGFGIATDVNGNVCITGAFTSQTMTIGTTTLTNTLGSGGDVFTAKYDATGNVLWAKTAGGVGGDNGQGISTDTSGNIFITGTFAGPNITIGTTTLTSSGPSDIFLAKYDSNGNELWAKSAGDSSVDKGLAISTDLSGNAFITGEFYSSIISFGTTTLNNSGDRDIFITKYDTNGNEIWAIKAGDVLSESGYGISTDPSGDILITGSFQGPYITFGNTTLNNNTYYTSVFITKLSQTTGIEIVQKESSITIPPNPFTYQTTINFKDDRINTSIKILDILGKVIKEIKFTGKELVIEKGTMQEGIYFVQTTDELNRINTKKIIIQ